MNSRLGVTATTDMAVFPGVLGCSFDFAQDRLPLRSTIQVRKPIPRYRGRVARWHAHIRGLATAIDKISGLAILRIDTID
jgi:hypothetical protein